MKKLGEIITTIAVIAFVVAMCSIDGNTVLSIITMCIASAWLVSYGYWQEEERKLKEGR